MTEPTDPTTRSESTGPTEPPPTEPAPTEPAPTEPAPTEPASPAIPAPDDDRVAVLAAYLRSNRGRFTDEALARAARAAGYSDGEIKAAGSLADPGTQAWGIPAGTVRRNNGVVAVVAIAYVIGLYLAISTAGAMSSDLSGAVALVGLLGGVIAWALLRSDHPSLAHGIGCGVVLAVVIPVVAILVILGICIATGSFPAGP